MKKKKAKNVLASEHFDIVHQRLRFASDNEADQVYATLNSSAEGLDKEAAEKSRDAYGSNIVTRNKKVPLYKQIINSFVDPFNIVLIALAVVSLITDIILPPSGEKNPVTVIIISIMILVSGSLRFFQEARSGKAAANLLKMISTTTCVERKDQGKNEIPLAEVVVGDIVYLSAGDMIPADIRICFAKDLFISQSALTGESEPIEKHSLPTGEVHALLDKNNLAFMGSTVISGSAKGIVVSVGNDTMLGEMSKVITEKPIKTVFEKGVTSVSWVLIRFMLVMVPIVFLINGFTKGDWMNALLFAISIAVGLTPEMLPMIVTTCLAKGAVALSHEDVIVKNLNSIQNLGSIDILCTDKTGTLTQDKVILQYHLDIQGDENDNVLRYGFLNSFYQTGLKNLIDIAIINHVKQTEEGQALLKNIQDTYTKVDEIPFDFERRRMSVVVSDKTGHTQMITKGAVEEMLKISSYAEYNGNTVPLTDELRKFILAKVDELNNSGMRVIALARKDNPASTSTLTTADESDMVLIGYLAFLDPPKETTSEAIKALQESGVQVKILTGDNDKVTRCVCRQVGLDAGTVLLGEDLDKMDDKELAAKAEKTTIFAKLSPLQKARVVTILKANGHAVGYMGDGINDVAAMKASDVGISVDTAVDIAKESAGVILLKKDLMVLKKGIIEGRKTYVNMIKYIKMTASSNFGNMLSVLLASAFLPFLPMASLHLILLNLIYDISCTAIPWDNVDKEYLTKPRKWDASSVTKFMLWMGPTSSVFDIATYFLMYFLICPSMCGGQIFQNITDPSTKLLYIAIFQTGWFIESMWSQTLVIHMIRTQKIPFIQSHASAPVTLLTFTGIVILTIIPFMPFAKSIGLTALPPIYFAWLAGIVAGYMILATITKKLYVKKFGELL